MKRTFILIFIPLGIPYDAFEIVKPLLFVNWLLFMFSISYILQYIFDTRFDVCEQEKTFGTCRRTIKFL